MSQSKIFNKLISSLLSIFVFVLIVDPANRIFGLKSLIFAPLLALFFLKNRNINKISLSIILIIYLIILCSSVWGFIFQINTDYKFLIFFMQGFFMLFLLFWAKHLSLIERTVLPGITVSIIVCIVYNIFYLTDSSSQTGIYELISQQYDGTMMIGIRNFLGIEYPAVYYSSAPILLIPFGLYLYRLLNYNDKKKFHLIILILMLIPLILGGTRAMMLSTIIIIYFMVIIKFIETKKNILAFLLISMGIMMLLLAFILLLGDKAEESLSVKMTLLEAFYNHISEYPATLVFGNGVGATFDSLGVRGRYAIQSEWTYLEFIRWFGLPLSIVFIGIYIYPIYLLIKNGKYRPEKNAMILAYICYLFLGGTNPYLYSSNGMLVLLIMYSYAMNPQYETRK